MNCDGCLNLLDNKCSLGKHKTLGVLLGEQGNVIKLNSQCIFKNTQHKGVSFDTQHLLAMTHIAVATYFIIKEHEDIDKLYEILDKEGYYGPNNPIGQFNVIFKFGSSGFSLSGNQMKDLSMRLGHANKSRLWNISILPKDESIDEFILNNCKLPYMMELLEDLDFAELQNFKYYCFSNKIPNMYGSIMSIKYLRKIAEEQNVENQEEGIV